MVGTASYICDAGGSTRFTCCSIAYGYSLCFSSCASSPGNTSGPRNTGGPCSASGSRSAGGSCGPCSASRSGSTGRPLWSCGSGGASRSLWAGRSGNACNTLCSRGSCSTGSTCNPPGSCVTGRSCSAGSACSTCGSPRKIEVQDVVRGTGYIHYCGWRFRFACNSVAYSYRFSSAGSSGNATGAGRSGYALRALRTSWAGSAGSAGYSGKPLRSGGASGAGGAYITLWPHGTGRGDVKRKVAITLKNQGEIKNKRLSHYAESRPGKTGRLFCVVGLERRKIFLVEN